MIHQHAGAGALRLVRGGVFGLWAVVVADTRLGTWAHLPRWMFEPPGVLALLPPAGWDALLSPGLLEAFRWTLLGLLLLSAGLRAPSRWLLVPAALGVLVFHGFILGWGGFLNHARMAPLYVTLFLALVDHRGAPSAPGRAQAALLLSALLVSVTYLLIGVHRVLVGGVAVFTGDALPLYLVHRTLEPGSSTFQLTWELLRHEGALTLFKVGFLVTTVAEILSPVALFHRGFRLAWLWVIVPFHLATLVTMNIFFWENLVLIALLFTELPTHVAARAETWRAARGARTFPPSGPSHAAAG
jgi:hypothetical protein